MTKPEPKIGQRWMFSNYYCCFITEIISSDQRCLNNNAKVIQILRKDTRTDGWKLGVVHWAATEIDEYTYLEGQDNPIMK